MQRPDPVPRPAPLRRLWTSASQRALTRLALWVVAALLMGAQLPGQTASIESVSVVSPPSVISVGDTVSILVTFSEAVDADANASFTLNSGGTATLPAAVSGVTALTFSYTVGVSDFIPANGDLDVVTADTLSVSDVTADTGADTPGAWSWPAATIAPAQMIRLGPQVVSVFCTSTAPSNATSGVAQFTVTYSEPVTPVSASDFTANASSAITSAVVGTPVMAGSQTAVVPVTFALPANHTATLGLSATGGADAAGNALVVGTPPVNQAYAFDTTVPTIAAFTLTAPSPTSGLAGHLLSYQVVFSAPVSAPTLSNLQITGVTSPVYTITPSGASLNSIYNITLAALPPGNPATVTLSIVPQAGTLLNAAGTALALGATAPSYTIDQTQPTVLAIRTTAANPSNGQGATPLTFQVTFSEPVVGVTGGLGGSFSTALTGGLGAVSAITVSPGPTTSSAVFSVTVSLPSNGATGTVSLGVNLGGITDAYGNSLAAATPSPDQSYSVIQTHPTVSAIQITSPSPSNGQGATPLTFQVSFSAPVLGVTGGLGGSFSTALTGGLGAVSAITVSPGPATSSAVFSVTVSLPTNGSTGTVSLGVNLGGVTDAYGNSLAAATPSPDQSYSVIQTQPTVTAIQITAANPTNGQGATPVTFQVSFSEPVSGVTGGLGGSFAAALGGSVGAATAITVSPGPTTSSAVFSVTVAVPTNGATGSVGLTVAVAGIKDAYGNSLAAATPSPNQSYSIIQTQPTVVSIQTTGANPSNGQGATPLTFQVIFSAPVLGVAPASFSAVTAGSLALSSGITVSPNPTTSSAVFSVTVALPNNGGAGSVGLSLAVAGIKDAYGNSLMAATPSPNQTYTVSQVHPTLTGLVAINPLTTSGVGATALQFLASFSTSVSGVAAGDFTATFGGSNFSASTVSAQGSATYVVTFPPLTANQGFTGSYVAALSTAGGITDALGNVLTASGLTATYTINQTAPVVSSITLLSANPGTAQLQFLVQFSHVVSGVAVGDFSAALSPSLAANASASVIGLTPGSGSSSQYTVTLSGLTATMPATGTLGLTITSLAGITDSLGNAAVAATPTPDQAYAITPPSIASVSLLLPNPNPAPGPVSYLVVFSTAVTGLSDMRSYLNFPFAPSPPAITGIGVPTVTVLSANSCSVQVGAIVLGGGFDSVQQPLVFNALANLGVRDALGNLATNGLPSATNAVYTITTEQPVLTLRGQPVTFQEGAVVTPIHVFDCTNFNDTGSFDFVSGSQQGTIDATIFTPSLLGVAPKTVSSDALDTLSILPTAGDQFTISNLASSPSATSATLLLAGATVGTFTYTTAQRNLHITLTGTTTTTDVQNLVNDIVFSNPGNNPSNTNRQIFLSVTDGNGKSSATYTQNVAVSLYNNTTPLVAGTAEITAMPPPRILQPGQALTQQHILTNDVDSFFVTSLYNASNVLVTPVNEATSLTLPTAKGTVTISLYGDWSYTANTGVSGEDSFTMNIMDIGPGKGQYVGGDALLAPVNVVQQIFIVPAGYVASSPSITTNPPVEAELGSSFDYLPQMSPEIDPSLVVSAFYDIVDQDNQGFVAAGDFVIDSTTGEVTASLVPTPSDGYIQFAILLEVTDTSGVTRGTYQPVVLKVVSATGGGG